MLELDSKIRSRLLAKAHNLKPVVMIGKAGLTREVTQAAGKALEDHQLIKVKFQDFKEDKDLLSGKLAEILDAALVRIIGNIVIFYRKNPEKKEIL